MEDQLLLRDELFGRVSNVRDDLAWLDIISKVDQPIPDLKSLQRRCVRVCVCEWRLSSAVGLTRLSCCVRVCRRSLGPAALCVSAQTNQGLVELGEAMRNVLVTSDDDIVIDDDLPSRTE